MATNDCFKLSVWTIDGFNITFPAAVVGVVNESVMVYVSLNVSVMLDTLFSGDHDARRTAISLTASRRSRGGS